MELHCRSEPSPEQAPVSKPAHTQFRMINERVKQDALDHAKREYPKEACGLVVVIKRKLTYWPADNIAAEPTEDFILDPAAYRAAEDAGDIVGIVHSHTTQPVDPSPCDVASCHAHGLPWYVVQAAQGTWSHIEPQDGPLPLAGRPWVWGATDCWTLVHDWYAEQGLDLPRFAHPDTPEAFEDCPIFDAHWPEAGFVEVRLSEVRYGDMILMNMRGKAGNHVGVIVDDGLLLHHARGCISGREPYTEWLQKCTERVLRHPELSA